VANAIYSGRDPRVVLDENIASEALSDALAPVAAKLGGRLSYTPRFPVHPEHAPDVLAVANGWHRGAKVVDRDAKVGIAAPRLSLVMPRLSIAASRSSIAVPSLAITAARSSIAAACHGTCGTKFGDLSGEVADHGGSHGARDRQGC